jgi:hypothetical protein
MAHFDSRNQTVDQLMRGNEPIGSIIVAGCSDYNLALTKSLNWFSFGKDVDDAKLYIVAYLRKVGRMDDAVNVSNARQHIIPKTFGWIARLLSTGAVLSEHHLSQFEDAIQEQLKTDEPSEQPEPSDEPPVAPAKAANSDDVIQAKISLYIGELESKIDHYLASRDTFNLFNDLKVRNINVNFVPRIKAWSEKLRMEFEMVRDATDRQLIEGYSNLRKVDVKGIIKLAESFEADCAKYADLKKITRKPRKVKEKTPAQLVKDLFYLEEFPELLLKSINPTEIIDAQQIWVYNCKMKKLGVYYSIDNNGLTVKGSTILEFDPVRSSQKVLRQPERQIPEVMRANPNGLNGYLGLIKTTKQEMTGRINRDTILLRKI